MQNIQLVDLKTQYQKIKTEVDASIMEVLENTTFINGPQVKRFSESLAKYLDVKHVIPCANGTDALQIAMMALELKPGDEVITPAFTYAATVEVIALLGLIPVFAEINPDTYNINPYEIEKLITPKTKAIVPVHLYGQSADMEPIMKIAQKHNLYVLEDTAQALGSDYTFSDGTVKKAGTIGTIGCTSFFPSKNLGCYGDGGAIFTNDDVLGEKMKMIANHGQTQLYTHDLVGVNSRLDSIQAAILDIKLKHLNDYNQARQTAAGYYTQNLSSIEGIKTPIVISNSTHVYHQYTIQLDSEEKRNALQKHLNLNGIPTKIYYPIPQHLQKAYNLKGYKPGDLPITEHTSRTVVSLPMHTELSQEQLDYIVNKVREFFN